MGPVHECVTVNPRYIVVYGRAVVRRDNAIGSGGCTCMQLQLEHVRQAAPRATPPPGPRLAPRTAARAARRRALSMLHLHRELELPAASVGGCTA